MRSRQNAADLAVRPDVALPVGLHRPTLKGLGRDSRDSGPRLRRGCTIPVQPLGRRQNYRRHGLEGVEGVEGQGPGQVGTGDAEVLPRALGTVRPGECLADRFKMVQNDFRGAHSGLRQVAQLLCGRDYTRLRPGRFTGWAIRSTLDPRGQLGPDCDQSKVLAQLWSMATREPSCIAFSSVSDSWRVSLR